MVGPKFHVHECKWIAIANILQMHKRWDIDSSNKITNVAKSIDQNLALQDYRSARL